MKAILPELSEEQLDMILLALETEIEAFTCFPGTKVDEERESVKEQLTELFHKLRNEVVLR